MVVSLPVHPAILRGPRTVFVALMLVVQQPWVHLGSRAVSPGGERDIIRTVGEDRFKRIRFVVEGGDLELFDVMITFADGKTFSPGGRFSFTGNSRSRVIALPGGARAIRWINFFYRRLPDGRPDKAIVHAYGRR
jgi:hypothetical protein